MSRKRADKQAEKYRKEYADAMQRIETATRLGAKGEKRSVAAVINDCTDEDDPTERMKQRRISLFVDSLDMSPIFNDKGEMDLPALAKAINEYNKRTGFHICFHSFDPEDVGVDRIYPDWLERFTAIMAQLKIY